MVRLQIHQDKDRWDGGWEFAERIEGILCLQCNTVTELLIMNLSAGSYLSALFPWSWCVRMERSTRSELTLTEVIYCCSQGRIVWRAMAFEDAGESCRIWQGPAIIRVIAKTQSRYLRITACSKHGEAVYPVEHPSSQPNGLLHQHAGIGSGRELRCTFR